MSEKLAYLAQGDVGQFRRAAPFAVSLLLPGLAVVSALNGGWWLLLLPLATWWMFAALDVATGAERANADPLIPDTALYWYRALTIIWVPVQFVTLFGAIYYATQLGTLSVWENVALFFGIGVITGTIGINYSHELMHQTNRTERLLADILLSMVLYSHFRSEHLLVHHRYVGTPRDPVTARYNEGFHRFFPRVLRQCLVSAFRAEAGKLARRQRPWHDLANPFFRYWALQALMLLLAWALGGLMGIALFLVQSIVAIWQLELVNYVEHYGLTRRHLGGGAYEPVRLHHSWNAAQKASNWLLINLQRHSDHHTRPDRRFPLLQNHGDDVAPQLPQGYPVMTILAMIPPLWRRVMNPKVRAWRRRFYPDIADWTPYNKGTLPLPR